MVNTSSWPTLLLLAALQLSWSAQDAHAAEPCEELSGPSKALHLSLREDPTCATATRPGSTCFNDHCRVCALVPTKKNKHFVSCSSITEAPVWNVAGFDDPSDQPTESVPPTTYDPSFAPTYVPYVPTDAPTSASTYVPYDPTVVTTSPPTYGPTYAPTYAPYEPTDAPTFAPTWVPVETAAPSTDPVDAPTFAPTYAPYVPTDATTVAPSYAPTYEPQPTAAPTTSPVEEPTDAPTLAPTFAPTYEPLPTAAPTTNQVDGPGDAPTDAPSVAPTFVPPPTAAPTTSPVDGATDGSDDSSDYDLYGSSSSDSSASGASDFSSSVSSSNGSGEDEGEDGSLDDPTSLCPAALSEGDREAGIRLIGDASCIMNGGLGCFDLVCRFCKIKDTDKSSHLLKCVDFGFNFVGDEFDGDSDDATAEPTTEEPTSEPMTQEPTPTTCTSTVSEGDASVGISMITDATCKQGGLGCFSDLCRLCKLSDTDQSKHLMWCDPALDVTTEPPATEAPVTEAPATPEPTTPEPTTPEPTTPEPTTPEPTTPEPTTAAPVPTQPWAPAGLCNDAVAPGDKDVGVAGVSDATCASGGLGCFSDECRFCMLTNTPQSSHLMPCSDFEPASVVVLQAAVAMASAQSTDFARLVKNTTFKWALLGAGAIGVVAVLALAAFGITRVARRLSRATATSDDNQVDEDADDSEDLEAEQPRDNENVVDISSNNNAILSNV